jgi:hypothetical protein
MGYEQEGRILSGREVRKEPGKRKRTRYHPQENRKGLVATQASWLWEGLKHVLHSL